MDLLIAAILAQDDVTSDAIYALLALTLVLVFSATYVVFIPQGELTAYGMLMLAAIQANKTSLSTSMFVVLGVLTFLVEIGHTLLQSGLCLHALRTGVVYAGKYFVSPVVVYVAARMLSPITLPVLAQTALTLLTVIPMGSMVYRLTCEPLTEADMLVLLIAPAGAYFAMAGLGLVMFGAEGSRTEVFSDTRSDLGAFSVLGQSLQVVAISVLMIVALYLYFGHTVLGKALWATAVNRLGAWSISIRTMQAGRLASALAAALDTPCGILIAPLTTVHYESGPPIGLRGFVGVIVGELVSYPVTALDTLLAGLLESYPPFWTSAFEEVIVFTLVVPVLLWRLLTTKHTEEKE